MEDEFFLLLNQHNLRHLYGKLQNEKISIHNLRIITPNRLENLYEKLLMTMGDQIFFDQMVSSIKSQTSTTSIRTANEQPSVQLESTSQGLVNLISEPNLVVQIGFDDEIQNRYAIGIV